MRKLFDAKIRWNDDGATEWVTMATYNTEGLPEDDEVFFCFDCATLEQLEEEIATLDDDFCIIEYDKIMY